MFVAFAIAVVLFRLVPTSQKYRKLARVMWLGMVISAAALAMRLAEMVPSDWRVALTIPLTTALVIVVTPSKKRRALWSLTRVVVLLAFLAFPAWVAWQMGAVYHAIDTQDEAALEKRVDFSGMRESVETQLDTHFSKQDSLRRARGSIAQEDGDEESVIGSLASVLSSGIRGSRRWLVKSVARSVLTPEGLKDLIDDSGPVYRPAPPAPPWYRRMEFLNYDEWRFWTENGWLEFARPSEGEPVCLEGIRFSERFLLSVERVEP